MMFLIDFDQTISKQCSCATMIEHFATADTKEIDEQWEQGKLSTPAAMKELFKILDMSEHNLFTAMKKVDIDPHFGDFLTMCEQKDNKYAIVSDGYSTIISSILLNHSIIGRHRSIPIYSNILKYYNYEWQASYPHFSEDTPNLGVSKSNIVKKYQQHSQVTFIGDGYTDYQAAKASDYVFAKSKLATYCENQSIPYFHYNNFKDIINTCLDHNLI